MDKFDFSFHFGYGSFLPILIFLSGIYIIYLFLNNYMSLGILFLLLSLILYIFHNVINKILVLDNEFNDYLENFAVFLTFGVTTIVYGTIIFMGSNLFIALLIFYSVSMLLGVARNSILKLKNSCGWPMFLNGLFFPVIFYFYEFYLGQQGVSIFVFYYLTISFLAVSKINFLGNNKSVIEQIEIRSDRKRAEALYDDMLKTDFEKKTLVKEVNDIFGGKKLL